MSRIPLGILASSLPSGGNALTLISTTVLGSNSNSITFSGIAGTYKHLQIRAASFITTGYPILMRFNSVTASNYASHRLLANGSSVYSQSSTSSTFIYQYGLLAGGSSTEPVASVIDVLDYANTNKYKTVRGLSGLAGASAKELGLFSGLWQSTSAVTSITFYADTQNFLTGTRFSLYGVS